LSLLLCLAACNGGNHSHDASERAIIDGHARFTVLSPGLVRLEYAGDGHFENRPAQTVPERDFSPTRFTTRVEDGVRIIRTSALTLRYRQGSGPFTSDNLSIRVHAGGLEGGIGSEKPGGWRRSLDNDQGPVPLYDGILSRRG